MQVELSGQLRLIACPHIFSVEKGKIDVVRPAGGSVADILRSLAWTREHESVRAYVDGILVQQAEWEYMLPRAGQSVVVRAIPMGGGGGGKDVMRLVAMVAVIGLSLAVSGGALAPLAGILAGAGGWAALAGGSTAALLAGATLSIAGTLALTGLIPTPLPRRALPQPVPEPRLQEAA